jgi:hypothetical protein
MTVAGRPNLQLGLTVEGRPNWQAGHESDRQAKMAGWAGQWQASQTARQTRTKRQARHDTVPPGRQANSGEEAGP